MTDGSGTASLAVTLGSDENAADKDIEAKIGDFQQRIPVQNVWNNPGSTTIQLDKPIYQPGQTMHVRILRFGEDGKAHAGEKQDLAIKNKDGDVEFNAELTTSAYGIAAADWEIPANEKAGTFSLTVENEESQTGAARSGDSEI